MALKSVAVLPSNNKKVNPTPTTLQPKKPSVLKRAKDGMADLHAVMTALDRVQAIIEFKPDGTIITANKNFLACVGYSLDENGGRHHKLFVKDTYSQSPEYRDFWNRLNQGEVFEGEFRRFGKNGEEIWLQALYNPIVGRDGRLNKVVKLATDITHQKRQTLDMSGQIAAIGRSQAVIEFDLDGYVLTANQNFLDTLGYRLDEIQGKHHEMFVESSYRTSAEYRDFWARLRRGEFLATSTNGLLTEEGRSGSKRVTIPSSTTMASRIKLSNTRRTLQFRSRLQTNCRSRSIHCLRWLPQQQRVILPSGSTLGATIQRARWRPVSSTCCLTSEKV